MRGLLVKDFCLLRQRTRFFAILVAVAVFIGFSQYGSTYVISYLALLTAIFSVSTVSYDEYDNCYSFLMTLPIDRKTYTREKYFFGVILGVAAWMTGAVIHGAAMVFHGQQTLIYTDLVEALIYIPMCLIMISLILPFQLKYGAERGRMVMLVVVAGAAAAIWALAKISAATGLSSVKLLSFLEGIGEQEFLVGSFLLGLAVTWISCRISEGIMEKKEL